MSSATAQWRAVPRKAGCTVAEASDHVIIGAGLAGAATAWHLSRAGHQVTVLERDRPASALGSSHGSARILRYSYPEPIYARLMMRARPLWDELEQASGTRLITPTGCLDAGSLRNPRALARVLEDAGVDHELLSPEQARDRFPMVDFASEVLHHPDAGVLDAESTVRAMLDLAAQSGARLETGWELAGVEPSGTGYLLTADDGRRIQAGHVTVAAGGWLPHLAARLPLPEAARRAIAQLTVSQEQAVHLPYRDDVAPAGSWPAYIFKDEQIRTYGLPGGRDAAFHGQKVAEFLGGRAIPSARQHDQMLDSESTGRLTAFAHRALPGVEPSPYAETTCLFTMTPSEHFLLDTFAGITVVSPCSGHGGKYAPLIGELAAGLATGTGSVPEEFRAAQHLAVPVGL